MRPFVFMSVAALAAALLPRALPAQTLPADFVDESVVSGLNVPTAFTALPDGRVLIAEKDGFVRVLKNGVVLKTPFIDLRGTVNDYWDRGLLAIAADLNFATNGFVYLMYVYENDAADYSGPKTARLVRVTASGDTASRSTEVVILGTATGSCRNFPAGADCLPADEPSHTVGNIKVAPDGTLFVTYGDASNFNVVTDDALGAQSLDSLAGKLLHLTTDGEGVSANPFWSGDPNAVRSKIWSYGFRNPYRFTLKPATSMPYVGDVGWGDWEEINVGRRGANLGWPCYEGPDVQAGYQSKPACQSLYSEGTAQAPLYGYPHDGSTSAVTGGPIYPGSSFPLQYRGAYFFGDYALGLLQYLHVSSADTLTASPQIFATGLQGPVQIDIGPGGDLWYVAINSGEIRRIRYVGQTDPDPDPGLVTYLSDLPWNSMTNGWGPVERDRSNGENGAVDGGTITLNGVTYAKGLGAHAQSDIRYSLGARCTSFTASVGVDDEVGANGSIVFEVWADGARLAGTGTLTGNSATQVLQVDVTGRQELSLRVGDAGNGIGSDHGDWADARVTCTAGGSTDTTPPVITAVGAAPDSTSATITWTTNEPADSQVEYGTTTAYGQLTTLDTTLRTSHSVTLTGLAAGTTYHYRVRSLDASSNPSASPDATFVTATDTTPPGESTRYLSDMAWSSMTNGWGPVERDRSNGENGGGDGRTITLNGVTYAKGLGTHAVSDVRFPLARACRTFTASIGVDDEVEANGSIVFEVWTDGVKRFDSGVMTGTTMTRNVSVDVSTVLELALIVTDGGDGIGSDHGNWADAKVICSTSSGENSPPAATISEPVSTYTFKVGDVIAYAGSAMDPEDGTIPPTSLRWTIVLFHCPGGSCHTHPFISSTGASGTFTVPDHGDESHFQINLTATDTAGADSTTTLSVQPQTVRITLDTSPTGLQVVYGGTSGTAPSVHTTIVGSTHTISAPSPQGSFTFSGWSDGGAQQHNVVAGTADITYVATFNAAAPAPTDTTPPTVTSVHPANGGTGVPVTVKPAATFSEPVNAATLTTGTVTLAQQSTTAGAAATISYDSLTRTVTLRPVTKLAALTTYVVRIVAGSSGVKDLAGNSLANDVMWTFTTR